MKKLLVTVAMLSLISCRDRRVLQPTLALPRPGAALPQFEFPTPTGGRLRASASLNTETVLFLWSTHCPTSRRALTGFRALLRDYAGRGVRVVMLSDDQSAGELALLPQVLADSGVRSELGLARGQLATVFDQSKTAPERDTARVEFVLPAYLVIGRDGRVAARSWGPDPRPVRRALDSLLASRRLTRVAADTATGGPGARE